MRERESERESESQRERCGEGGNEKKKKGKKLEEIEIQGQKKEKRVRQSLMRQWFRAIILTSVRTCLEHAQHEGKHPKGCKKLEKKVVNKKEKRQCVLYVSTVLSLSLSPSPSPFPLLSPFRYSECNHQIQLKSPLW